MFHEVKIFDKKGKVKKVLSGKNINSEYWNSFFNNSLSDAKKKCKGRGQKPQNITDWMIKVSSDLADFNP